MIGGGLTLAGIHLSIELGIARNEQPSKAVAGGTAHPKTKLCQSFLCSEYLDAQLTTVFCRHHSFQRFEDRIRQCSVVLKQFGTVVNRNACVFTYKFVVGGFVGVLKSPPSTHIVDQNCLEDSISTQDIGQKLFKTSSRLEYDAALASVGVGLDYGESML